MIGSSTLTNDQGKYIQDELIERSEQLHRLPQFARKVPLAAGNGKVAEFIKYNRTDVPVDKLSEGVTPAETAFTISRQTITVDQWGLYITLTDVAEVTTKHPVLNEALDLVADAIARCQDYNLAEVLNAGTNKQFWEGSRANRGAITATDTFNADVFTQARVDLNKKGAPGYSGDMFVIVVGPQVEGDIISETASNSFISMANQQDGEALKKGKIGKWLGFDIIRSNFMPVFTRLTFGGTITATTGGSLSGTVYYKVTRKDTTRGFEEDIAVEANTVMGANTRLQIVAPSTSGYVYNVYAGSVTGDANLYLAKENLAPSATYNLDSLPGSGTTAPATPAAGVVVHPLYIFASKSVDWVELNGMAMDAGITPKGRSDSDPLQQRRRVGSKYMSKAGIRDQDRMKVVELASSFS